MDNGYRAREADLASADKLYAVIRPVADGLSLDAWRQLLAATVTAENPHGYRWMRGIVAIECEREYARALFIYSVTPELRGGPTLVCDNFVVFDQFGIRPILATMLAKIRELARRYECNNIHINLDNQSDSVAEAVRGAGFSPSRNVLCGPSARPD